MNRRQRRANRGRMKPEEFHREDQVPVYGADNRVVALIARKELHWYEHSPNARLVANRAGQVVRVNLESLSDDTKLIVHRGDPRHYSHDHETTENPPRVWTIRRLARADTDGDRFVQRVFRSSVLDNLKEAA